MDLPDLKKLDKLIALCRKRGVKVVKVDNLELILSDEAPSKASRKARKEATKQDLGATDVDTDEPTDETLMFWSSQGGEPATLPEQ